MNIRISNTMRSLGLLLAATMLITACQPKTSAAPVASTLTPATPASAVTPAVKVSDQAVLDGKVTVAEVDSAGPGWMVIHNQKNGAPGEVIGYTAVKAGVNMNVVVTIDVTKATLMEYAMLHVDAGTVGTYEFPGADVPAVANGQPVTPVFTVYGLPTPTVSNTPSTLSTPVPTISAGGGGGYSY